MTRRKRMRRRRKMMLSLEAPINVCFPNDQPQTQVIAWRSWYLTEAGKNGGFGADDFDADENASEIARAMDEEFEKNIELAAKTQALRDFVEAHPDAIDEDEESSSDEDKLPAKKQALLDFIYSFPIASDDDEDKLAAKKQAMIYFIKTLPVLSDDNEESSSYGDMLAAKKQVLLDFVDAHLSGDCSGLVSFSL
ncbi:hypothetical protein TSUD_336070 [Trifolium subterraneum]|uniref:Uncharacterized protein n=1 Tax=Trifolium subterraneum TaxID=3900 RepID=A0A2Z6LS69_TRISU|nr:hypothetical protein TSUD_336070 [Trifolium subterraneum]